MPGKLPPSQFSSGWLRGYKNRNYNLGASNCVTETNASHSRPYVFQPERLGDYELADIFVCDEMSIFLNIVPTSTLKDKRRPACNSHVDPSVSVFLCCNLDGSAKITPYVFGTQCEAARGPIGMKLRCDLDYLDSITFQSWLLYFEDTVEKDTLLLISETLWSQLKVYDLPSLKKVWVTPIPAAYNEYLPMDARIAKEFKLRYHTFLYEASRSQSFSQLSLAYQFQLILDSWRKIPLSIIKAYSIGFLKKAGFPQGNSCTSDSNTEGKTAEDLLKKAMKENDETLYQYYRNQDKNTGPTRQMREQVERVLVSPQYQ
ncbi:hypothetical protein BGZ49_004732 [Haplosporangium sp. Z 27]|nr:hypothetical protein BGZ49_004732 [Haplosporangium sp. Z 27]